MPSEVYFKTGFGRRLRRITWAATAGLKKVNSYLFTAIGVIFPPTVTTAPSISGTTAAGDTLTCTPGVYSGSPVLTRHWQANAVDIAGATGLTYVIQAGDAGKSLRVRETATNDGGNISVLSNSITAA
jgi:hypothetical protein